MTTTFCTGMCYEAPHGCNCGLRPLAQPVPVARGWLCVGCGQGWAPHVDRCEYCGPQTTRAIGTTNVMEMS